MKEQRFNIYIVTVKTKDNEPLFKDLTAEDVKKFIAKSARNLNYGIYRYWRIDDKDYYDCGPITYVVKVAGQNEKTSC